MNKEIEEWQGVAYRRSTKNHENRDRKGCRDFV